MLITKFILSTTLLGFISNYAAVDASSSIRGTSAVHGRILEKDQSGTFLEEEIDNGDYVAEKDASGKKKPQHTINIELENGRIYTLENVDPMFTESKSGKGLKSGRGKITIGQGAIISGGSIDLQGGAPEVIEEEEEAGGKSGKHGEEEVKGKSGKYRNDGGRHLEDDAQKRNLIELDRSFYDSPTLGEKTVLAIRVEARDGAYSDTEEHLSQRVFGTGSSDDDMNLVSQYKACSYNKLNFVKATHRLVSNGVKTIKLTESITQGREIVRNAITVKINQEFRVSSPSLLADHVIYCLPKGTWNNTASAYVNHWLSVYNDHNCNIPTVLLHEVGHNLGFRHSRDGGVDYEDRTGLMGYTYSGLNGPRMCLNGAKSYQSGWYHDATKTITPMITPAGNGNTCFIGRLYGVAEYEAGNSDKTVIIKINDYREGKDSYFVAFNRALRMNYGTQEGRNSVIITKARGEGENASPSELIAKLNPLGKFAFRNFAGTGKKLVVEVVSRRARFPEVRIQLAGEQCEGTFPPTPSPKPACIGNKKAIQVNVRTDEYSDETSWSLTHTCSGTLVGKADIDTLSSSRSYSNVYCVHDVGEYRFTIEDSYSDGLCCHWGSGSYSVEYDGAVVAAGGRFRDTASAVFGSCP